ncbi:16S rRNA (adenine(1518)-N(6)/adenine(1519)-N(6))-dimethyltransferase RsmA [Kocuria palustris]|uniref:16S rRNA (adenine(1518)-N(6)/adenine(1519)-N(6))- dimethyltransferase RsmA n=1 Tax=Kocuria palustris TaxID=71999 RepID=UPI002469BD3B|nr:16S rRNA (adenine(1518)-N(6)/adenine(1519)-N(6))-dimethyltransferase RsmA [Kocuria palustris]MDH5152598.1 16S rRNA (adenine(1518)-N(6)/adenine(1519)-N(6))-dimethyltransferase RsmA [Kocuria palustris]
MSDVQSPDAPEPAVLPLLGPAEIRELAASAGIRPTKTLGQNFVIDPNTIRRIVAAARLEAAHDDGPVATVLEVGPGLGSLTLGLLDAVEHLVAVEIDPPLAAQLPHTVARFRPEAADRLEVVLEDALQVASLPREPEALVANLPYNVAVPVLLNLLARFPSIRQGLVMVQDEVADRLAARPGSKVYGVPSVKASWHAEVEKAGVIGTQVFWPAPRISSGLVRFRRRAEPLARIGAAEALSLSGREGEGAERDAVFAVVDAAFAQRRKTLRAALSGWAGSGALAEEILVEAGIAPSERGEKLDVLGFASIAAAGASRGIIGGPRASIGGQS